MPHHIYHTRALVIHGKSHGDADRMIELFTEHFGKIVVHSRGIRRESSRLRYVLQPLSWVEASVVRGSGGWRMTTANPIDAEISKPSRQVFARIIRVISLFLPNDIAVRALFHELWIFSSQLREEPGRIDDWELIALVRILFSMGYWGESDPPFFITAPDYRGIPVLSQEERATWVEEVNRILRTTPL